MAQDYDIGSRLQQATRFISLVRRAREKDLQHDVNRISTIPSILPNPIPYSANIPRVTTPRRSILSNACGRLILSNTCGRLTLSNTHGRGHAACARGGHEHEQRIRSRRWRRDCPDVGEIVGYGRDVRLWARYCAVDGPEKVVARRVRREHDEPGGGATHQEHTQWRGSGRYVRLEATDTACG